MDRATVFGTVGWGFDSLWVYHINNKIKYVKYNYFK